jgi:hypothetical protein
MTGLPGGLGSALPARCLPGPRWPRRVVRLQDAARGVRSSCYRACPPEGAEAITVDQYQRGLIMPLSWAVEYTDQFEVWWDGLSMDEQGAVAIAVEALEECGPALGAPIRRHGQGLAASEHEGAAASGRDHPRPLRLRPAPVGHPAARR